MYHFCISGCDLYSRHLFSWHCKTVGNNLKDPHYHGWFKSSQNSNHKVDPLFSLSGELHCTFRTPPLKSAHQSSISQRNNSPYEPERTRYPQMQKDVSTPLNSYHMYNYCKNLFVHSHCAVSVGSFSLYKHGVFNQNFESLETLKSATVQKKLVTTR